MTDTTHPDPGQENTDPTLARVTALAQKTAEGRVSAVRLADGRATVVADVSEMDAAARENLENALRDALMTDAAVSEVRVAMTATKRSRTILAVGSGKGGVGKSTLTTNLALALRAAGHRVGVVDADIYGPSQPRLLGLEDGKPTTRDDKLVPVMTQHGIPLLSMGQLAKPGQAVAWRGPMASRALEQLIDAHWDDVDVLLLDLPPGTGDIQLSMLQKFKPAGAVIVSTPQDLALIDAARAIDLFRQGSVPVIGMVENMAGYACPHCGEVSDPFGNGGAEREAAEVGLPFLGRVPLDRSIRLSSDAGIPPVAQGGSLADPFRAIAAGVSDWLKAHGGR